MIGRGNLQPGEPAQGLASTAQERSIPLLVLGVAALLVSAAALYARFSDFEWVLQLATRALGDDGSISVANRAALAATLVEAAVIAAISGVILMMLSIPRGRRILITAMERDALHHWNLSTPSPYVVLAWTTAATLIVVNLWLDRMWLGRPVLVVFAKEGPMELVTFLLLMAAAFLCFGAARLWQVRNPASTRLVRSIYLCLGLGLFLVAMEEINWGQTLIGFATPEAWSRINYQQETSIHNLVDRNVLDELTSISLLIFGLGALLTAVLGWRYPRSVLGVIAPHLTLVPLALCVSLAGVALHAEVAEFLVSVFFAFYSYRIWLAARSGSRVASTARTAASRTS